jgi:hypothetical protein
MDILLLGVCNFLLFIFYIMLRNHINKKSKFLRTTIIINLILIAFLIFIYIFSDKKDSFIIYQLFI